MLTSGAKEKKKILRWFDFERENVSFHRYFDRQSGIRTIESIDFVRQETKFDYDCSSLEWRRETRIDHWNLRVASTRMDGRIPLNFLNILKRKRFLGKTTMKFIENWLVSSIEMPPNRTSDGQEMGSIDNWK